MQSEYGVPELQQFMVDSCASLLSVSHDMNAPPLYQQQKQQHGYQQIGQRPFLHPANQAPATQHFFLHHQFPGVPFAQHQQQQRRLHQELGLDEQPEGGFQSSGSPPPKIICGELGMAPPRFVTTNFSLAVNEPGGGEEELNGEVAAAGGGSHDRTVARWHQQPREEEESAIKEPFWKRLDMEYMSRNSKNKEKLETLTREGINEEGKTSGSNYGLFSELEAIYSTRSSNGGSAGSNQAGSGSALTGDNTGPTNPSTAGRTTGHGSETSTGEEASRKKLQKSRRKSRQKQLSSIAGFFQGLVKQLMNHQESLNCKFLEVVERKERERTEREEAWRRQETARLNQEAAARAQEQALASNREAAIISYLEKISGESLRLPSKTQLQHHAHDPSEGPIMDIVAADSNKDGDMDKTVSNVDGLNGKRWPRTEVQALIRIRIGLESRFQEPGLKAPLWDEVSASMAAMGYQRSSKRCKEKWENINKYFRKTKDSAKKRPRHSKTCPYFHQLDQLYSRSNKKAYVPAYPSETTPTDNYELLDAIVETSEQNNMHHSPVGFVQEQNFKYPETVAGAVSTDDDCNEVVSNELNARQVLLQLQERLGNEDEDQDQDDEYEDEVDEERDMC